MTLQFSVGGAVIPFITILFRERGMDFAFISQVFLAASCGLLVFPLIWGMLADRFIPLNRLFTLLNLLIVSLLAILTTQNSKPGLLIVFCLFYACFNPSLSLINALSFHHLQYPQEQFGRLRAWGSLGWIIPSLPIAVWLTAAPNVRLEFVLYLGMGLSLAMALAAFLLPHTPSGTQAGGGAASGTAPLNRPTQGAYWPAVKRLLTNMDYLVILVSFFLVAGSFFLLTFYSPPFLVEMGVPRAWIGPVQSLAVVVEIFLFRHLPRVLGRWNYTVSILIGCGALVVRHLLFAGLENPWLLSFSYVFAGAVIVFYHNGVSILVNAMAGPEVRATAQTLLVFVSSGLGPMFANFMAGRLVGSNGDGLHAVFLFAAILPGLAGILILIRGRSLNRCGHLARRPSIEPVGVLE